MIHTKGEAGIGNVVEAVRHVRSVMGQIRFFRNMDNDEVFADAKKVTAQAGVPYAIKNPNSYVHNNITILVPPISRPARR